MNLQFLPWIAQNSGFVQNHLIIYSKLEYAIILKKISYLCLVSFLFLNSTNIKICFAALHKSFQSSTISDFEALYSFLGFLPRSSNNVC